jgi:hypothetical protein
MQPQLRKTRFVIMTILTLYINLVLTNIVSLRQYWYQHSVLNGTKIQPLYDSLFRDWVHGYNIPSPTMVTMRDMVDFCTYSWVILVILSWALCSRKPIIIAKGLMTQMILIPAFSIAQLLTIIPDSTPNCLEIFNIPTTTNIDWVFWRYPKRACGNMIWSSDITQLIVFTSLATQMIPRRKRTLKKMVWAAGELWTLFTLIFVFSSQYQYSVDVVTTYVIVKLAITNPTIEYLAKYFFVENGEYFERVLMQELPNIQTL